MSVNSVCNCWKLVLALRSGYASDSAKSWRSARPVDSRPPQQAAAENSELSGALRQLFALSEAYPDLKANTNFQQLQTELTDIENKIAAARRFFNNAVQEYNTGIQRFPAASFAFVFRFCAEGVLRSRRRAQDRRRSAAGEVHRLPTDNARRPDP